MTGIGLATKGKICGPIGKTGGETVVSGGGGVIYKDEGKHPTKKECERLFFPKVRVDLTDIGEIEPKIMIKTNLQQGDE